jgi:hypothetical protein
MGKYGTTQPSRRIGIGWRTERVRSLIPKPSLPRVLLMSKARNSDGLRDGVALLSHDLSEVLS